MKKVFFALAVVAMFSFVACNGSAATEDTMTEATVEEVAEEVVDETAEAVEGAVEETAAEAEATVAE